jgi:hypothetical protein
MFFTTWQSIALDSLLKGQKYNQEYFVQNIFPSLLNDKKRLSRQKTATNFSRHLSNFMCHNEDQVVDELRRLKILRALHPPYSPGISLCDFWMFRDFKGKPKDCYLQAPEEILTTFQKSWENMTFEEVQKAFESMRDWLRWIIEHDSEYFCK